MAYGLARYNTSFFSSQFVYSLSAGFSAWDFFLKWVIETFHEFFHKSSVVDIFYLFIYFCKQVNVRVSR